MISILIPNHLEPRIHEVIDGCEALFSDCQIIIAVDRYSRGKGWAIRQALAQAKGDIIAFIDGDMDIDCRMFKRMIPFLDDYDIVVGRKQVRGIPSRRILTRLSRWFIQSLFGLGIDTQTGIKIFKREHLPYWDENGYLFDLEILAKAKYRGARIIEVPVEANITRKMKGISVVKCFLSAIRIWSNLCHDFTGTQSNA